MNAQERVRELEEAIREHERTAPVSGNDASLHDKILWGHVTEATR